MTKQTEALRKFFEGLADQACKEALAETQEPVAFLSADTKAVITRAMRSIRAEDEMDGKVIKDFPTPLYTTPPSREWVGLSDAEITHIGMSCQSLHQVARAIEAKLREKNNG